MQVKICGLTRQQNIAQVMALRPDYTGLIFYPGSKRYAGKDEALAAWLRPLKGMGKTGVFVNEQAAVIMDTVDRYGLDYVQLHGDETPAFCKSIHAVVPVIKVFPVDDTFAADALSPYTDACTYVLFDTASAGLGGSGRSFNWDVLHNKKIPLPFFISGGIGPGDVAKLKALRHPACIAADINSRFEDAPGMKNIDLLKTFIHEIRH